MEANAPPDAVALSEMCSATLRSSLPQLMQGDSDSWERIATCVRTALVFLSKTRKSEMAPREDAEWWQRWAQHDASSLLLRVLKMVLKAAPAALQVHQGASVFMLKQTAASAVVNTILCIEAGMELWPKLKQWMLLEHGCEHAILASLSALPVTCEHEQPTLVLEKTAEICHTFTVMASKLPPSSVVSLTASSMGMHGEFLTENLPLLATYRGSIHVQSLVREWCSTLQRQLEETDPGSTMPSWQMASLFLLLPVLLFLPIMLPQLLLFMSGAEANSQAYTSDL